MLAKGAQRAPVFVDAKIMALVLFKGVLAVSIRVLLAIAVVSSKKATFSRLSLYVWGVFVS